MIVYISGPITGHEEDYLKRFAEAETKLRKNGHDVVNPAWINEPFEGTNATHEQFLEACTRMLAHCEAIYMLRGWKDSAGAQTELKEAQRLGLWVMMEVESGK